MNGKSRSTLFLIEKLIVILVFALCAAACAEIFVESFINANDARDLNFALVAARNGAERYKAGGDLAETAESLGGQVSDAGKGSVVVFFDGDWQASAEYGASYVMHLRRITDTAPYLSELSVEKVTGEEILSFTVAARGR